MSKIALSEAFWGVGVPFEPFPFDPTNPPYIPSGETFVFLPIAHVLQEAEVCLKAEVRGPARTIKPLWFLPVDQPQRLSPCTRIEVGFYFTVDLSGAYEATIIAYADGVEQDRWNLAICHGVGVEDPTFFDLMSFTMTFLLMGTIAVGMLAEFRQVGWLTPEQRAHLIKTTGKWAAHRAEAIVPEAEGFEKAKLAAERMWKIYEARLVPPPPPVVPPPPKGYAELTREQIEGIIGEILKVLSPITVEEVRAIARRLYGFEITEEAARKLIEEAERRKPPPLVGTVKITSEPEGVSFEVKGPESFKGKTPFTKEVSPGEYTITWKALKGYAVPKKETLRLEAGKEILFHGKYLSTKEVKEELAKRMAKLLEEKPAMLEKPPEELAPSIIAWAEKDYGIKLIEEEAVGVVERAFELLEEMGKR